MMRGAAVLLLLFAVTATADDVAVSVTVDPYEARVGDPVTITISVTALDAATITLSALPEGLGDGEVLADDERQEVTWLGARRLVRRVVLAPFKVGDIEIPPLDAEVIARDGSTQSARTPPALIPVRSVSPSEAGPENIVALKDILEPPPLGQPLWLWIAVGAVALAVVVTGVWFLRRRTPRSVRQLLRLTPAQRALRELDELAEANLPAAGHNREFYTTLANILRRYIGLRYHVLALEMTSTELRAQMEPEWRDNVTLHEALGEVLLECDMVKFARTSPEAERGPAHIAAVRRIVEETRDDAATREHGAEAA